MKKGTYSTVRRIPKCVLKNMKYGMDNSKDLLSFVQTQMPVQTITARKREENVQ